MYSVDFREAVLSFRKKAHNKTTCETFNIPKKTYHNWTNLQQQTGSLQPKKHSTRKRKINPKNYNNT
jgi:transposase